MRPIAALDRGAARRLRGIFSDIDDTLTKDGRLEPAAYHAIARAQRAGLKVWLVSGRPAGAAKLLGRLLGVDGVVAENGAVAVQADSSFFYWDDERSRREHGRALETLAAELLAELPFARRVDDRALRHVDVVFDIGERARLTPAEVAAIVRAIERRGARAVVSTVHAHACLGEYDKAKMLTRIGGELWRESPEAIRENYLYVGDSPNDQACFAFFPLSVGVANVADYAAELSPLPAFVTSRSHGEGFTEMVEAVLALRAQ